MTAMKSKQTVLLHPEDRKIIDQINIFRKSAQRALASDRPDKAMRTLELALRLNPGISHLHLLLSQALACMGNRDRALIHADLALKLNAPDPEQAEAWKAALSARSVGKMDAEKLRKTAGRLRMRSQCHRAVFSKQQGGDPGSSNQGRAPETIQFEKALAFRHNGKLAEMKRLLRRFISTRPRPDIPLFIALMETRSYAEAFQLAENILSRYDDDIFILRQPFEDLSSISPTYFKDHAVNLLRLRLSSKLERWKCLYLGLIYSLLYDHDAALEWFGKMEKLCGPSDNWMLFEKARLLLMAKNDPPAAMKYFQKALAVYKRDWPSACYMAEIDICSGREARGFRRFQEVLSKVTSPGYRAEILAWRGNMRLLRGQYGPAVRDLETALAKGSAFARCWLGAALLMLDKTAPALEKLEQVVRIMPQDSEASVWYGEALRRVGRPKEARLALLRVFNNNHSLPNDWAAVNLMILECDAGNETRARKYFLRLGGKLDTPTLSAMRAAGLRLLRLAKGHRSLFSHQGIAVRKFINL